MSFSVLEVDRKPQASDGNRAQAGMPFMGEVQSLRLLEPDIVAQATFNGCLVKAAQHCGLEDQDIADKIHISHGYMSRFMRGVAQKWARRLIAFMRVTQCYAPLQWIAHEMGCEVVPRSAQAARIAKLESELAMARRAA